MSFLDGFFGTFTNVRSFGAIGDGVTNDTEAFQASFDYLSPLGGALFVPRGTYLIDEVHMNTAITMFGEGRMATIIKSNCSTGSVVDVNYGYCSIREMKFTSWNNRTEGAYIKSAGNFCNYEDLYFEKYFGAINITNGTKSLIKNCVMYEGTPAATTASGYGISVGPNPVVGLVIDDVLMDSPSGQPQFGILLTQSDACVISNCDIIRHGVDLAMTPGNNQGVHATYVSNSFFDSAIRGILCLPSSNGTITRPSFSNVWANSHTGDGIYLAGIVGTAQLNGVRASLNSGRGVLVASTCNPVKLNDVVANENGSDGIAISAGTTGFKIQNCEATVNGGAGVLLAGSNSSYVITGNDLRANHSGGLVGHIANAANIAALNLG